jgi:prohibitin 1
MTLLLLGLLVGGFMILATFAIPRSGIRVRDGMTAELSGARWWLRLLGAAVIVLAILFSTFRVVPAGHVGVATLFGRIDDRPLSEGLNMINPLKQVHLMSVRTQEMFEHADVPSKEGLSVGLDVSALYHLDLQAAPGVYRTLGENYARVYIAPQFRSVIRGATVNHEAKDLYTSGREVVAQEMYDVLHQTLLDRGIVLEKVLLRKIVLPKLVEDAINTKLVAEPEAERMRFVLVKERQEAERKRVEAAGIADFQRIVTQGISEPLLKWKAIEVANELSKSPNAKVVILGDKSGLPIILSDK